MERAADEARDLDVLLALIQILTCIAGKTRSLYNIDTEEKHSS